MQVVSSEKPIATTNVEDSPQITSDVEGTSQADNIPPTADTLDTQQAMEDSGNIVNVDKGMYILGLVISG